MPPQVHAAFAKFEEAKRALYLFIEKNQKLVDLYNQHRDDYNMAAKEVKALYLQHSEALGPSYGGLSVGTKRSIDTELLLKLLPGIREFMDVTYKLSVAKFEELVSEDAIPEEVQDQVLIEVPNQVRGAAEL